MTHEKQNELSRIAILRHVVIRQWTGRGEDKELSAELSSRHGVSDKALKANKQRIPAKYTDPFTRQATKVRAVHRKLTLPWSDTGMRVLPVRMLEKWDADVLPELNKLSQLWDEFFDNWDTILADAKRQLKDTFREEEYPSLFDLRRKFSWDSQSQPFPNESDFRVDLAESQITRIKSSLEKNIRDSLANSTKEMWGRLYDVVNHLAERWGEDGKVYDTAIGNIQELVNLMPSMNIAQDPKLDELTGLVKERLANIHPDDARKNKKYKQAVAKSARNIAETIAETIKGSEQEPVEKAQTVPDIDDEDPDAFVMGG